MCKNVLLFQKQHTSQCQLPVAVPVALAQPLGLTNILYQAPANSDLLNYWHFYSSQYNKSPTAPY